MNWFKKTIQESNSKFERKISTKSAARKPLVLPDKKAAYVPSRLVDLSKLSEIKHPYNRESEKEPEFKVTILAKYKSDMDQIFAMVRECMDWKEFVKAAKRIETLDRVPDGISPNAQAAANGKQVMLYPGFFKTHVAGEIGKQRIINKTFMLLHEIGHQKRYDRGEEYGGMAEERACNAFADEVLARRGYKRTVVTAYD